jgi:hypothetical protein
MYGNRYYFETKSMRCTNDFGVISFLTLKFGKQNKFVEFIDNYVLYHILLKIESKRIAKRIAKRKK